MPLEQIGASLQIISSSNGAPGSSVYDSGHRGKESDHSDTYGDEEASWNTSTTPNPALDDGHDGGSYMSNYRATQQGGSRARRPQLPNEDMTLLKLGGVGGVQRSGSARYGRKPSVRTQLSSSVSATSEDEEGEKETNEGGSSQYEDAAKMPTPTATTSLRQIVNTLPSSPARETPPPRSPSFTQSPRRRGRTLVEGEVGKLPSSPLLNAVVANDLRTRLDTLSLSAAAQAQQMPAEQTLRSSFVPQEPRRHTGSFALRSRSALARTLGSDSLTFGNGLGRAASRRIAKEQETEQQGSHRDDHVDPDTPRANAVQIPDSTNEATPQTGSVDEQQSRSYLSTSTSNQEIGARRRLPTGNRSVGVSPRTRIVDLIMSPALPLRVPENAEGEQGAPASTADYFGSGSDGIRQLPRSPLLPPSSPFESELSAFAQSSLPVSRTSLGVFEDEPVDGSQQTFLAAPNIRPGNSGRASSSALSASGGVNVLRTPTTEEWSRFLINQGLNPTQLGMVNPTGREGTRSRSNTSRSQHRVRGRLSERDWGITSAVPIPSGDEEDGPEGQNVERSNADLASSSESIKSFRTPSSRQVSSSTRGEEGSGIGSPDDDESIEGEDMERDLTQMPIDRQRPQEDYHSGSDEYSSDEMDEHMRVLNEIISRPPSRIGTPAPSESGHEKMTASAEALRNVDARRGRWPLRETAAVLSDYPLPPFGEQRSITDFVEVDDIGRGAYGLVKKVRLKDEKTGKGVGSEFCIKYIIKSRILADCWRRHKILGPIPVEIHVLDQLRRLSYVLPSEAAPWSAERLYGLSPLLHTAAKDDSDQLVAVGHPSLCMMVDFFEDHEFYYLVMPCFGRGQDLFDYVESQPHGLNTKQVRCIFGQLADGLSFLHDNNIVHRDVKDENVILDGQGHIQLIDFGSAAHINTRYGGRLFDTFSGTLDYAAAEILRGEKYGGKEQDVWALGVVGYVLLCGDCPFWNGEEAMHGLRHDTRAFNVLSERCRATLGEDQGDQCAVDTSDNDAVGSAEISSNIGKGFAVDAFTGRPYIHTTKTSTSPIDEQGTGSEARRRSADLRGQKDGGGRLQDAADLIMQCLQLELAARPTMRQVCQHRFLAGAHGWSGRCGWLSADCANEYVMCARDSKDQERGVVGV